MSLRGNRLAGDASVEDLLDLTMHVHNPKIRLCLREDDNHRVADAAELALRDVPCTRCRAKPGRLAPVSLAEAVQAGRHELV